MSENINKSDLLTIENFFEKFKTNLKQDLNIYESLDDEEYQEILTSIIKEYESEFYNDFSDIFIYNYYQNLLNSGVMNQIIEFVRNKVALNNTGKEDVLKAERTVCKDTLYLYGFEFIQEKDNSENKLISKITGKKIPINYLAAQIITNDDVFFIPPKGDPKLRGPHVNYTIEYGLDYWLKYKEQISNYIKKFEKSHPTDYIDDLNDYRYWLNKYRVFTNLLNQTNTLKEMKEGEKHVKN